MKKILIVVSLVIIVASCAHKTTPPNTGTAMASEDRDAGKQIYTAKCGRCHGLKDPANYSSDEWVSLVNKMAPKAQLNDTEKANVLAYVQANAKH
jgi:mono/diheme cytochrome c family protein